MLQTVCLHIWCDVIMQVCVKHGIWYSRRSVSKSVCSSSASLIVALSPCLAVIGLWHWSRKPSHWQYGVQDRLVVKQLQFACEQAFPAALHWQLTYRVRRVDLILICVLGFEYDSTKSLPTHPSSLIWEHLGCRLVLLRTTTCLQCSDFHWLQSTYM